MWAAMPMFRIRFIGDWSMNTYRIRSSCQVKVTGGLTRPAGHLVSGMAQPFPGREAFASALAAIAAGLGPARGGFANIEGGSVEQHVDARLLAHHAANYAAGLALLSGASRPLRLVELGCGSGSLTRAFARAMPAGWRLVAVDYSAELVQRASRYHAVRGLEFRQLDVSKLRAEGLAGFDVVLMFELIEHLDAGEAARLLHTLHAGLGRGGRLIFSTLDRAPFPRPASGYGPHRVEYSHATLCRRLADPGFNPFERRTILRLVSPRIAAAAVQSENRGGYLANRAAAALERLPVARALLRVLVAAGYRLAKALSLVAPDPMPWLGEIRLVEDPLGELERESFGLVALLEKR
jgi:SAM-dependent methyltransferase